MGPTFGHDLARKRVPRPFEFWIYLAHRSTAWRLSVTVTPADSGCPAGRILAAIQVRSGWTLTLHDVKRTDGGMADSRVCGGPGGSASQSSPLAEQGETRGLRERSKRIVKRPNSAGGSLTPRGVWIVRGLHVRTAPATAAAQA